MNDYVGLALSFAYLGIVLFIAVKLEKQPYELSRKFVHIMSANWWLNADSPVAPPHPKRARAANAVTTLAFWKR